MDVSIFPSLSRSDQEHQSIEDRLIDLLSHAASSDDDDEFEDIIDEVLETILSVGPHILSEAAPTPSTDGIDLHSLIFMFPPTHVFRLATVDGNATITRINPVEKYTSSFLDRNEDDCFEEDSHIDDTLPVHSTRRIVVQDLYVQGAGYTAALVQVDSTKWFCKVHIGATRFMESSVGRELASLQTIRSIWPPALSNQIRVPQLMGYVREHNTGRIAGFLGQWVPGEHLRGCDIANLSRERRLKWASQVCEAVGLLHSNALIWGDGKASNVIIDEEDDSWLIDFGGGFTEGWIDAD
ncbi:hypothetical protein JDV02_003809 [Purpureocillium takamizusanense]|uniref:Protein kinase domain-containing protein n=1 Tax=Purpureocillium takamizusanense TaxID=2060973 RepID=A0A9Q8QCE6_9HYPO|nr:uncharacterized protein JDV02_003809 [Purpureocillium takamizusanense]UNI17468.1 hypothetical protein JDV02_003809 [Purpureocillium takamizusanense]